ncbi:MAG: T9SS type A sorting domain-containing protein [Bacteroidales bacterium]|nr:T9SS type A sorting domain-containing protein [Bacteroidales bacterium]
MQIACYIKTSLLLLALCCLAPCQAQQRVNALFIGNSYTEVNNLPAMVQQIASSMGDQLTYQSNTPGGCTFSQHCGNRSMELIRNGGWDIVVLQEQSQYPSFPQWQVEAEVFPYAKRLVDSVYAHSPCGEPMFYMTWGRKNGDAGNAQSFPVLGTYEGMDSMLCERYTYMAQQNDASLCPVGRVWRYLRENHGDIELYQSDESHPSVAGTYAAACAFYVMFFHRDPDAIVYDASLPQATAQTIRSAVRRVVYENIEQWKRPRPQAAFTVEAFEGSTVSLTSSSLHADSLTWFFGDGTDTTMSAGQAALHHTYPDTVNHTITLIASRHCMTDTFSVAYGSTEDIVQRMAEAVLIYPNPAKDWLTIALTENAEQSAVTIFSLDGRQVATFELQNPISVLDVGSLPTGEYLLQITRPAGIIVRKIVIHQ